MLLKDRYINPFTDFGFKKIFGSEVNKESVEAAAYEESLKVYRDLKNVVDTAYDEGKVEGKAEGIVEGSQQKAMEVAKSLKDAGLDIETISRCTGLPVTLVEGL